ncbi:MAG: hypothetical protein ACM3VW_07810 [Bacteroidota bacterium]
MSDVMTRFQELGRLFWRSARESGEAAAEAIEQRALIQKLALQVRKLDKERSGLVRQIGAKVYSLHSQGKVRNQDVLIDCKRIDMIMAEIAQTRKEIEKIRAASLERGIEVPILTDEAPLDIEEPVSVPVTGAVTAPTNVHPAGTVGQQDLPAGGVGKASQGREEFDENGDPLLCVTGPSTVTDDRCDVEAEIIQEGNTPMAQAEISGPNTPPPDGPSTK